MLSPISTYDICRLDARTIGGLTSLDFGCRFGGIVLIGVVRTQRTLSHRCSSISQSPTGE
ncbi:MAG: hypothetical protein JWO80_1094 [Bryobacterales bacterium]|nr:hypothetical protein [Bryobacterales bacterium]